MKVIRVEPTSRLEGTIHIPGSKNSALALIVAACLADDRVTLHGIPNIADIRVIAQIGAEIGLNIERDASGAVHVDSTHSA